MEELQVAREDVIDLEDHRAQEQDQEPVVQGSVRQPGPGITHQRLHQKPATETPDSLPPEPGAAVVGPERPARGPTGEEVEHEPDESGDGYVEDDLEGRGDVAEHLTSYFEVRMVGNGPQQPQGQGSQGEEDSEALEDLRCCRASLLRCGLLLPLLGQGHGA